MGIFDNPQEQRNERMFREDERQDRKTILSRLTNLEVLMTEFLKKQDKEVKQDMMNFSASPVTFDARGYKHSTFYAQSSSTLTITTYGGVSYNLSIVQGSNLVDFPGGCTITANPSVTGYIVWHDQLNGFMMGVFQDPMNVSLTGSTANFSNEGNASTTDTPIAANVTQWFTFSNDDTTNNIQICFDAAVGSAGTMTLKPGDVVNGMPRKFTTLHIKAAAGTPAYRAWGV